MAVATIRNLLVIVLVVCIDGSLIYDCLTDESYFPYDHWPTLFRFVFAGSVPMLSAVVVVGAMALPGRGRVHTSLVGFTLLGAFAIFSLMGLALVVPWEWFVPLFRGVRGSSYSWYRAYFHKMKYRDFLFALDMALFITLFTTPELVIALVGAWLGRPEPDASKLPGILTSTSSTSLPDANVTRA
jgi:hypothetical protein